MKIEPYWFLVSYPKSGNTWCRIFLSDLHNLIAVNKGLIKEYELNLKTDLRTGEIISKRNWLDDQLGFDSSDLDFNELDNLRGKIEYNKTLYSEYRRYYKVHDSFYTYSNNQKSIVNYKNCSGIVYLIRNPFDITISLSNFFNWSIDECIDFITDEKASLCNYEKKCDEQVRQFLGDWDYHVNSWINQNKIPKLIIKYEDLLENPFFHFKSLVKFLNIQVKDNLINQAISNSEFKNLQNKEKSEGGFLETTEYSSQFFRLGKSGEGIKKLNDAQIERIVKKFSQTLKNFDYLN